MATQTILNAIANLKLNAQRASEGWASVIIGGIIVLVKLHSNGYTYEFLVCWSADCGKWYANSSETIDALKSALCW